MRMLFNNNALLVNSMMAKTLTTISGRRVLTRVTTLDSLGAFFRNGIANTVATRFGLWILTTFEGRSVAEAKHDQNCKKDGMDRLHDAIVSKNTERDEQ